MRDKAFNRRTALPRSPGQSNSGDSLRFFGFAFLPLRSACRTKVAYSSVRLGHRQTYRGRHPLSQLAASSQPHQPPGWCSVLDLAGPRAAHGSRAPPSRVGCPVIHHHIAPFRCNDELSTSGGAPTYWLLCGRLSRQSAVNNE
jgi:hypothetical protein